MGMIYDPDTPLARCKGESNTANVGLHDYYTMGATRSLVNLYREYRNRLSNGSLPLPPTGRLTTIKTWSQKNGWVERVSRQEEIDRKSDADAKARALEAEAQKWAERRIQVRERDWSQAEAVRKLTDAILEVSPNYIKRRQRTVKGKNGGPDTIIIQETPDMKLMLQGLRVSSQLQRLAAEMETDHTLAEVTSPEELEEIRKRRWKSIADQLKESSSEEDDFEEDDDIENQ
jgi:hypothetical protein